jgi:Concanavalin A-like lectin/glucanases superfamily
LGRTQLYIWGSQSNYPFGGLPLHNALYGEINPGEVPGGWAFAASPVETISPGEWHYIAVVFDAKGKAVNLYSDGIQVGGPLVMPGMGGGAPAAGRWTQATFPTTPTDRVEIGAIEDLSHAFYDGLIDELRVETAARSPEWLKAQAIAVTGEAITLGPEETSP